MVCDQLIPKVTKFWPQNFGYLALTVLSDSRKTEGKDGNYSPSIQKWLKNVKFHYPFEIEYQRSHNKALGMKEVISGQSHERHKIGNIALFSHQGNITTCPCEHSETD